MQKEDRFERNVNLSLDEVREQALAKAMASCVKEINREANSSLELLERHETEIKGLIDRISNTASRLSGRELTFAYDPADLNLADKLHKLGPSDFFENIPAIILQSRHLLSVLPPFVNAFKKIDSELGEKEKDLKNAAARLNVSAKAVSRKASRLNEKISHQTRLEAKLKESTSDGKKGSAKLQTLIEKHSLSVTEATSELGSAKRVENAEKESFEAVSSKVAKEAVTLYEKAASEFSAFMQSYKLVPITTEMIDAFSIAHFSKDLPSRIYQNSEAVSEITHNRKTLKLVEDIKSGQVVYAGHFLRYRKETLQKIIKELKAGRKLEATHQRALEQCTRDTLAELRAQMEPQIEALAETPEERHEVKRGIVDTFSDIGQACESAARQASGESRCSLLASAIYHHYLARKLQSLLKAV